VDYCGLTVPIVQPHRGEIRTAQVFVAVLSASNYTYAEATWSQSLQDWLLSHMRTFEFFGGVPEMVIPDYVALVVMWLSQHSPRAYLCFMCKRQHNEQVGFVTTLARQDQGPSSMTAHCSVTRVFLRYALREGLLTRDLTPVVVTVQRYRIAKVPRSITWAEVGLMLDSVERRSSTGKRDYALLLLLVSYGLRAREVAALTLDDIDWERDRLLVPERKAGHCTEEWILFRRVYAPHVAMTHHSVSSRAVHYLRKAGIKVHRPGSHTLRHTCVQHLIDADFSLKSAGDFVGHGSLSMSCLISRQSTRR